MKNIEQQIKKESDKGQSSVNVVINYKEQMQAVTILRSHGYFVKWIRESNTHLYLVAGIYSPRWNVYCVSWGKDIQ